MKKLIPILLLMTLLLAGCGSKTTINIDDKLTKLTSLGYDNKILDEDFIKEKKDNELLNKDSIIPYALINKLEYPSNALPDEFLFNMMANNLKGTNLSMWGNEWIVNAYDYNLAMTSVIYVATFEDEIVAKDKIFTAAEGFLKTYGNIIFDSNIYSFSFDTLAENPIYILSDVPDFYAILKVGKINGKPAVEVSYIRKNVIHNLSESDNLQRINELKDILSSLHKEPEFKTFELDMHKGYVVYDKKENLSDQEKLNEKYIFTK